MIPVYFCFFVDFRRFGFRSDKINREEITEVCNKSSKTDICRRCRVREKAILDFVKIYQTSSTFGLTREVLLSRRNFAKNVVTSFCFHFRFVCETTCGMREIKDLPEANTQELEF